MFAESKTVLRVYADLVPLVSNGKELTYFKQKNDMIRNEYCQTQFGSNVK